MKPAPERVWIVQFRGSPHTFPKVKSQKQIFLLVFEKNKSEEKEKHIEKTHRQQWDINLRSADH